MFLLGLFLLAGCLLSIILAFPSFYTQPSSRPIILTDNNNELIIPAGKLQNYADSYPWDQDVYVRKLDGTIDSRADDLEELCKDWYYYRYKIIEADVAGNADDLAEYQATFKNVNYWLEEYSQSDVTTMFGILTDSGYTWPPK